jgi:hypothetical protein
MMKLNPILEPDLIFARGNYPCPKIGIASFDVYDSLRKQRRHHINVGAVGTNRSIDKLTTWLEQCQDEIPGQADTVQPRLYPGFPGFRRERGFMASLVVSDEGFKSIREDDLSQLLNSNDDQETVIEKAIELFIRPIEYLTRNHRVLDVIICVIPDDLFKRLTTGATDAPATDESEEESEEDSSHPLEHNFRRGLKARALELHLDKPLQLVKEKNLTDEAPQDDATKAWNFCTALYYKSNQTVPWKLDLPQSDVPTCFVGIGFYKSRDRQTTHSSLAQIFDEFGKNVILRGAPAEVSEVDRQPHLKRDDAEKLLERALADYDVANEISPARLVVHKTSKYTQEELEGFKAACQKRHVKRVDFISFLNTSLRAFRTGNYPPPRGTHIQFTDRNHLLYTRGAVHFYKTYTGLYVPQPLEIRIEESDQSPDRICREILALTKLNWNNTRMDGKYPITILCARKVGEIMKYLPANFEPRHQISYSYFM